MNMSNVDEMFKQAAAAEEDTGEGPVGGAKQSNASRPEPQVAAKPKEVQKVQEVKAPPKPVEAKRDKVVSKPEPRTEPRAEVASREVEAEKRPLINSKSASAFNIEQGITEDSITRILEMNSTFNKFEEREKLFVSGYFQIDEVSDSSIPQVIYGALTADHRDLEALTKITKAKKESPAERAFYLMDLNNDSVEAIHEQVELLTGELGKSERVHSDNKIAICRRIEKSISDMPDNIFVYIDKLQSFTNKALEK